MHKMYFLHNDSINKLNFGIISHFILYANSIIPVPILLINPSTHHYIVHYMVVKNSAMGNNIYVLISLTGHSLI